MKKEKNDRRIGMKITPSTAICCNVADPKRSLTLSLHNAAAERLGLDSVFFSLQVTDIGGAIAGIKAFGLRFLSVGDPHKTRVIQYLDSVEQGAKKLQRVNSVLNDGGRLLGYNSDIGGAVNAFKEKTMPAGKKALVIGSGESAKALTLALLQEGAAPALMSRDVEKGWRIADALAVPLLPFEPSVDVSRYDIVVNATSLGMADSLNETAFDASTLQKDALVFDVVFNPSVTVLNRICKKMGVEYISGGRWLVHRVAFQVGLYTQVEVPSSVLDELEELLTSIIPFLDD